MKLLIISVISILIFSCSTEKTYSIKEVDGVKITRNKNLPANPDLKYSLIKRCEIDFYNNKNSEVQNFKYPISFDIDKDGNIYILDIMTSEIKKFDSSGNYLSTFGKQGSGPGETIYPSGLYIKDGTIYISNSRARSLVRYSFDGEYIGEERIDTRFPSQIESIGENYIGIYDDIKMGDTPSRAFRLAIFDDKMKMSRSLYDYDIDIHDEKFYNNILDIFTPYDIGDSLIYLSGNSETSYRVDIYNFEGKKVEEIEKQYREVEFTEVEKGEVIEMINMKEKLITDIPAKSKKSISNIVYESDNTIWVMTPAEKGESGVVVDIFRDGVFINRFGFDMLEKHHNFSDNLVFKIKDGLLYQLSNKDGDLKVFEIVK